MMTIDQLSEMRKNGLQALIDNEWFEGFKRLLTDLYPDNAHFIYELLQNAEDAGASKVHFVLNTDRLEFEHNGNKLFKIDDIKSITSIGTSTKADDTTNIGKFGIGFKAVFAYTNTPEIESGPFHFRIRGMVVPDTQGLVPGALGKKRTRFVFPFDTPEKSPEKACAEIEAKLRDLNENTLLFLSNIRKIEYRLPNSMTGSLKRIESNTDRNQIEISITRPEDIGPDSVHYLRFEKNVDVRDEDTDELKRCQIAVAFGIDKPQSKNKKIRPLDSGQVCIYFPAESETSKLRFHLHAPFASTVARASIRRNSSANEKLRDHLADLVAGSMAVIRDQGLLDVKFLAILPNSSDELSPFYLPIQKRLIEEFNREKLVPTRRQDVYAPASELYRDRSDSELSGLIQDRDLATLLQKDDSQSLWVADLPPRARNESGQFVQDENARRQNEMINDFLTMLDISEWTIEDFIEVLEDQPNLGWEWLKNKEDEWHQRLYILLGDYLSSAPASPRYVSPQRKSKLSNLCIIRCSDGEYRIGTDCHFIEDSGEQDKDLHSNITVLADGVQPESQNEKTYEENFHYVATAVYLSGSDKDHQERSRKFLETVGVCKVNDTERVKAILEQRYTKGSIKPRDGDIEKFIDIVEDDPEKKSLFKDYFIFEVNLDRDDSRWFRKPSGVFVDSPYLDTGLTIYHSAFEEDSDFFKRPLSPNYAKSGINLKRFGEFAQAVGAQTKLAVEEQRIPTDHPEYSYLVGMAKGQWRSNTGKNEDYVISEVKVLLEVPSIEKSKLIWQTMRFLPEHCLHARFWNNRKFGDRAPGKSSLVHELKDTKWVPQENTDSVSFVRPCDASVENLPKGFPYEAGRKWIGAIEFGKTFRERSKEYAQRDQQAKNLGFDSSEKAEKYAKLDRILKEQGISTDDVISQYSSRNSETKPKTGNGSGQQGGYSDKAAVLLPEEISETEDSYEGARKQILVNTYERDRTARDKCLQHYGKRCTVCEKDMSEIYGPEAEGLIHVHHLKPLSEVKEDYRVNPIADLRPVCPNCHAVIHRRRKPPYKIEEVKGFLEKVKQDE